MGDITIWLAIFLIIILMTVKRRLGLYGILDKAIDWIRKKGVTKLVLFTGAHHRLRMGARQVSHFTLLLRSLWENTNKVIRNPHSMNISNISTDRLVVPSIVFLRASTE